MEIMNKPKEKSTPVIFQRTVGEPLPSEQRINELFPRILSRGDLLALFIVVVLFIPNVSLVQATQAGPTTYIYWIIGTITFLIPGAVITGQLNRFLPSDGSIYVWTHRALGPLWGFFAGFCAWFPGILAILTSADGALTMLQGIGVQLQGEKTNWFAEPWQQGIVVLSVLFIASWIATLPLPLLMKLVKAFVVFYGVAIATVGLAGVVWLISGHPPQVPQTTNPLKFGEQNIALYGVVVLALLGVEVPLNLAAETTRPDAAKLFLRWGPVLVLIAYLVGTFGVMVVVPQSISNTPYSTITAISLVFGAPTAVLASLIFIAFFIITATIYHITFARILVVSALDQRLPPTLSKLNRHGAPLRAITVQTIIVIVITFLIYFLGPLLSPGEGVGFSSKVYNISEAATVVIWCFSMIILFLDLPILLSRFRKLLAKRRNLLVAPTWILYLCCGVGGATSMLGIWITLIISWDSQNIPNGQWTELVGVCTLAFLVLGLIGSSYPRLFSSLKQQTSIARENARLYNELRSTSAKPNELDRLKETLLTSIDHELRTPLTIVQGYLELLHSMEDTNPDLRRSFLENARYACDELVSLQTNIMDASRIEFDTATLHCTRISLKVVSTAIVDLFEPLLSQEQRQIKVDVADDILVWADVTGLKQVLHHLITNALRYSPPQTPICLAATVAQEDHMAYISITDRGAGIPLDKHEAIFDKFMRLERDLHGVVRGSGLGLFITRQLVEAMQGTITVESSGVANEGSTFSFTLPLAEE